MKERWTGRQQVGVQALPWAWRVEQEPELPWDSALSSFPGDGEGLTQVKDSVCLTQNIKGHHAALSKGHRLLEAP